MVRGTRELSMRIKHSTPSIVALYNENPSIEGVKLISKNLGISVRAIMARLYRARVIQTPRVAMYVSDADIQKSFSKLNSRLAVSETLGVSFYTVTAALDRLGIPYKTRSNTVKQDPTIKTYYFWPCRYREDVLKDIQYIVGGRPNDCYMGTIRARNMSEALQGAPGRSISKKQLDTYNKTRTPALMEKLLHEIEPMVSLPPVVR